MRPHWPTIVYCLQLRAAVSIENLVIINDFSGDPGRSRTCDLRFRKPSLYPSELQGHATYSLSLARIADAASRCNPRDTLSFVIPKARSTEEPACARLIGSRAG